MAVREQSQIRRPVRQIIADRKCPRCGSGMFKKPACCAMRKRGWQSIVKCLNPRCSYKEGYEKRGGAR